MRNFNVFLLILTFLCCLKGNSIAQNCNLPAPTGFTWTYPTQNTVKFTWNSVSGAWGYRITMNAQNTQGQGQTIQAPVTEATFTYVPNTTYDVELFAGCSATDFSPQKVTVQFTPDGLIIVTDINPGLLGENCYTSQPIWHLDDPTQSFIVSTPTISSEKLYKIQFKHAGETVNVALKFLYFSSPAICTTRINLFPTTNWLLGTIIHNPNSQIINRASIRRIGSNLRMDIFVSTEMQIVFMPTVPILFTDLKIFECAAEAEPHPDPNDNGRNQENIPTYAASPNPFLDQISVFLKGQAQGRITAKMLDAAGQLKWIQQYDSTSLQDQAFVIQTQDMPAGMYFLQISDARGLLQTRRLIKQ
jgi:hypothetical protein